MRRRLHVNRRYSFSPGIPGPTFDYCVFVVCNCFNGDSHDITCVSFLLHGCCGEWEGGPVNQVNHTSKVAVVTPTDRPKSVRNCCLIELFCGVVYVVNLPFWHFCRCRGFCHRTGSDFLLFVFVPFNFDNIMLNGMKRTLQDLTCKTAIGK